MKTGASIELVWQLAAREAIAAEYREIEPEHLLAAVLKFAELPLSELEKSGAPGDAAEALRADVDALRNELHRRSIDSCNARHKLRARLGKGGCPFPGGTIHRSQASRDLFDAAAEAVGQTGGETVTPRHFLDQILSSPTAKVAEVLGCSVLRKMPGPSKTPLLDAIGRDLTRLAAEGKLPPVQDRKAECKALLEVLGREPRRSVLLISETEEVALSLITAAAQAIARKDAPLNLRGRRVIDIGAAPGNPVGGPTAEQAEKLLGEAAVAQIILYMPAVDFDPEAKDFGRRVDSLVSRLKRSAVQCVCRIEPQSYALLVRRDKTWKQAAEALFVHEAQMKQLPREL